MWGKRMVEDGEDPELASEFLLASGEDLGAEGGGGARRSPGAGGGIDEVHVGGAGEFSRIRRE